MIISPELEAVVGATHQVSPAPGVTIMLAPVPGPVTVTLPLVTRGLRGAAPPVSKVPAPTSLTWNKPGMIHRPIPADRVGCFVLQSVNFMNMNDVLCVMYFMLLYNL